jgi:site-specific DNA-methyltransferase (adenine-specific)
METKNGNMPISHVENIDCMIYMRSLPSKSISLAVCDPPYGIGEDGASNHSRSRLANAKVYSDKGWDRAVPNREYFSELSRVSKIMIIWGANHFIENIPNSNSPTWIVWDKLNGENDFADCELAWSNHGTTVRKFEFRWAGMLQGDMKNKEFRIHPTQKPVALYKWILENYAKAGDKILDTHLGSQSSRIAAYDLGFDFFGTELDSQYFDEGCARFEAHRTKVTEIKELGYAKTALGEKNPTLF